MKNTIHWVTGMGQLCNKGPFSRHSTVTICHTHSLVVKLGNGNIGLSRGARKLMGEDIKVIGAEFSTLS